MATPLDFSGANPVGTPSALDTFNASNQAISFREQLPDLSAKLRDALTTKFNESPLFKQRETAQQQFLAAPSAINADISRIQREGQVFSPTQQQAITGERRAAAFAPLSTANLLLNTQFGGLENMIGGGVKAFEAASNAQTERANLMNKMREQEIERQFKEEEMKFKWASLNARGTSESKTAMKEIQKKQESLTGLNSTITAIANARQALQQGGAGIPGFFANLRKRIPAGIPGALGQKTSGLDSALATVNKALFETAGKAFTQTEAQILGGRVPKVSYQPEHIKIILDELEREALNRQLQILGGQYDVNGQTDASEWEIIQ